MNIGSLAGDELWNGVVAVAGGLLGVGIGLLVDSHTSFDSVWFLFFVTLGVVYDYFYRQNLSAAMITFSVASLLISMYLSGMGYFASLFVVYLFPLYLFGAVYLFIVVPRGDTLTIFSYLVVGAVAGLVIVIFGLYIVDSLGFLQVWWVVGGVFISGLACFCFCYGFGLGVAARENA